MIEVEGLTYTYPAAAEPAIRELTFRVARGEIFGFLGPSGAGKSTTQKILIALLRGYGGEATVLGKPVREWRHEDYRRIGVSFELPNHYLKLTAEENLRYFGALYGSSNDPQSVLEEVGLGEDAQRRVAEFSKGMRGRLNGRPPLTSATAKRKPRSSDARAGLLFCNWAADLAARTLDGVFGAVGGSTNVLPNSTNGVAGRKAHCSTDQHHRHHFTNHDHLRCETEMTMAPIRCCCRPCLRPN